MFCSNVSFATFSLMFFPLFSRGFTDILQIYELPKIYNKKYCETFALKIHAFFIRNSIFGVNVMAA